MNEKRLLTLILGLFALLGVTYSLVTPVFEASDELWHYPMVRHLADGNPLPVQVFDPALAGPWKQEASQPPLYYYLGAALTFGIDTSDMGAVRWENPHVDNGIITPDGNNNLVIHDPARSPWQGTLLAVHVVRLFSVALGVWTVWLTYKLAKEVLPERPELALGATAVTAFIPMFLFISGAVNNDNLIVPLCTLALLQMSRIITQKQDSPRHWLALGAVIGLACLTKITGIGLLALAGGTAVLSTWQADQPINLPNLNRWLGQTVRRVILLLIPFLLIAGWWYVRNIQLYGDWKGWSAFIAVLGQRAHPASLAQLWSERWGFMLSYWGLFGGVNIPMPLWIYRLLNAAVVLALFGFPLTLWQTLSPLPRLSLRTTHYSLLTLAKRHFPLLLCLLWSAAIVLGLIGWATTTWSSQGRLVFSSLPSLTILLLMGLAGWLPKKGATAVATAFALFLFLIAAAAPFLWIRPAYALPQAATAPLASTTSQDFGTELRLTGYEISPATAQPGDQVQVQLAWQALQPTTRNWSVFVHLEDPVLERPIAQRDMYPGQGLLATSLLKPGQIWHESYTLTLPPTAIAPADLQVAVGLYDFATGERLPLTTGEEMTVLATVPLQPVPGDTPNPLAVNFDRQVELVGFEVSPRRAQPGDTVQLALYWRPLQPFTADYTFFAQLVNLQDTTRWASQDLAPTHPTTTWPVGEVQKIELSLVLDEATPTAVYPLIIGLYTRTADGGFDRLQMLAADGRPTDDFLNLTPVRVDP